MTWDFCFFDQVHNNRYLHPQKSHFKREQNRPKVMFMYLHTFTPLFSIELQILILCKCFWSYFGWVNPFWFTGLRSVEVVGWMWKHQKISSMMLRHFLVSQSLSLSLSLSLHAHKKGKELKESSLLFLWQSS